MSSTSYTISDQERALNTVIDWEIAWADAREKLPSTTGELIDAAWGLRQARTTYIEIVGSSQGIRS